MPNLKISEYSPSLNIRKTTLSLSIKRGSATARTLTAASTFGGVGYPLGILMSITTNQAQMVAAQMETLSSDFRPIIRIK